MQYLLKFIYHDICAVYHDIVDVVQLWSYNFVLLGHEFKKYMTTNEGNNGSTNVSTQHICDISWCLKYNM